MVNQVVLVIEIANVVTTSLTVRVNVQKVTQARKRQQKFDRKEKSSGGSRPMKGRTFADHQK